MEEINIYPLNTSKNVIGFFNYMNRPHFETLYAVLLESMSQRIVCAISSNIHHTNPSYSWLILKTI